MLKYILGLLTMVAVVAGCSTYTHSDDCNALQGRWHIVSAKESGVNVSPERLSALNAKCFNVNVHELTPCCACPDCTGTADIVLDPTASPKEVTFSCIGKGCSCGGSHVTKGIYTIENDTVTFCTKDGGSERPADFSSVAGSGVNVYVLKRCTGNHAGVVAPVCTCDKGTPCDQCPVCKAGHKCDKCATACTCDKTSCDKCPVCAKGDKSACPKCACSVCDNGKTCTTCAAGKAATCDTCKKNAMVDPNNPDVTAPLPTQGEKLVVPKNNFRNGVLTVFYPNTSYAQIQTATNKAIKQLGTLADETSIKNRINDGSIAFAKSADGTLYNCTMAPAEGFTIVRIFHGDWGHLEESYKIANKIADNL